MLITDEWIAIIDQAEELSHMLLSSTVVENYRMAHRAVYGNEQVAKEIREFAKLKERYEEVQRFGRYHPDYHIVMKDIRIRKRELDINEQIAALKLAENDVQALLDEVGEIIARSVSEAVKVVSGNGFLGETGCSSGGCSSGGSCSCSA